MDVPINIADAATGDTGAIACQGATANRNEARVIVNATTGRKAVESAVPRDGAVIQSHNTLVNPDAAAFVGRSIGQSQSGDVDHAVGEVEDAAGMVAADGERVGART